MTESPAILDDSGLTGRERLSLHAFAMRCQAVSVLALDRLSRPQPQLAPAIAELKAALDSLGDVG
jgi:hypothetical protein